MAEIKLTNRTYKAAGTHISAGDHITLAGGNYKEPLVLTGLNGTARRPIFVRPANSLNAGDVVFRADQKIDEATEWANRAAAKRQHSGYYPTFAHLGDQAILILKDCKFVAIQSLDFDECYPTAIYLDNCQYIVIHDVQFKGGTLAIGADGINTHDIVVQHCFWKQDTSAGHKLWNEIPWDRVHGAKNNSPLAKVDLANDYRRWDGDFFRGWNVGSNIVIRKNRIEDAFNAIHFFNSFDRLSPGVKANNLAFNGGRQSTANVLIEDNEFVRIRDNVFEPEYHAWNWVIRHNHLFDCYRPFSFEFERAGWFYIYGNTGAFVNKPSQKLSPKDQKLIPLSKRRPTPSLFKPKGKQANEGPIYVFNNSWYFEVGKGLYPKFALGNLVHINNAVKFKKSGKGRFFGSLGAKLTTKTTSEENERLEEIGRFTRRWHDYNITLDGDINNDENFPNIYRSLGYTIGDQAKQGDPGFKEIPMTEFDRGDFTVQSKLAQGAAINFLLEFPDGSYRQINEKRDVGAAQSSNWYSKFDQLFEFLPDEDWVPKLNKPRSLPQKFIEQISNKIS